MIRLAGEPQIIALYNIITIKFNVRGKYRLKYFSWLRQIWAICQLLMCWWGRGGGGRCWVTVNSLQPFPSYKQTTPNTDHHHHHHHHCRVYTTGREPHLTTQHTGDRTGTCLFYFPLVDTGHHSLDINKCGDQRWEEVLHQKLCPNYGPGLGWARSEYNWI